MSTLISKVWAVYTPLHKVVIGVFVLLICSIGLDFVWPFIYGRTLDSVISGSNLHTTFLFLLIAFGVMLVQNIVSWLGGILQLNNLEYDSPTLIQTLSLKHILGLSIGQHRNEHSGLTQSVVSDGQNAVRTLMDITMYQLLPYLLRVVIGLVVLMVFSWQIGVVVLAGTVVNAVIIYFANKHFIPFIAEERDMDQDIDKKRYEILRNAPLVISNAAERETEDYIQGETEKINIFGKGFWNKYYKVAYIYRPVVGDLTLIGSIAMAAFLVLHSRLSPGQVVSVVLWTSTVLINLGSLSGLQRQILFAGERARKYFDLLDLRSDVARSTNAVRNSEIRGEISFNDVSFIYHKRRIIEDDKRKSKPAPVDNGKAKEALKHLSFDIKAGEHVAFVGASGAGKSTALLLLLRGSDPQEGTISIDGVDLRDIDIDFYRRHLGVVEQHIVLFDDTIRRNISFGLPDGALLSDAELDRLAKIARIDEFKDKLVEGWDTIIGENGIKLSGGQRQRVGIARALAKNPSILILDEATSSLDAKNEALIKDALHDASEGRTTIMIAHRLSTVKDADRIFVFDKGEIVGIGKHEELLKTSPIYADLVSHQTVLL
ncbi:ABC transporter ATP-binding protein/permease [Candidatus Parcubacteria bacterium]|nr:ABC transporter ATP-binding protein/permease [Candidatus Parcubacteria bacterium]